MPRTDQEELVQLALGEGLVGPEKRRLLLRGLPMGFVYNLPTVSRPIDQLRFDLMELYRTPRLTGLERSPLSVWLENAASLCATAGAAGSARRFADAADAQLGTREVSARIEALLGGPADHTPSVGSAAGPSDTPAGAPQTEQVVVALAPAVGDVWRTVQPPIALKAHHVVEMPGGQWRHEELPHGRQWRKAHAELVKTLDKLPASGALAVFAHGPTALSALAGVKLAQRADWTIFESTREAGQSALRAFGPSWSREVRPAEDLEVGFTGDPLDGATDVVLAIQLDRRYDTRALDQALESAGIGDAPRRVVGVRRPGRTAITRPECVEAIVDAITDAFEAIADVASVQRLHLVHHGPDAILMRAVAALPQVDTVVYEYQQPGRYAPAVHLGGAKHGQLFRLDAQDARDGDEAYDAFIAYTGADLEFATGLFDALKGAGKQVFLDQESLLPGDLWDTRIPEAQARAAATCVLISRETSKGWYLREEVIQAIRRTRSDPDAHRIIPILLGGIDPHAVPYGLGRVHGITVGERSPAAVAEQVLRALGDPSTQAGVRAVLSDPAAGGTPI